MLATILTVRLVDEAFGFLRDGTLESWRAELHLDYRQAAMVLVAAAPGAIAGNVLAIAADHRSRRVVACSGGLVFATSLFTFGFGHSFAVLAASSFAFGFGATGLVDGLEVALVDLAGDDLEALVGRSNLLAAVGDLLGPVVVAATAALGWSWRVPFVVCGVLLTLYSLAIAMLPLPPPHRSATDAGRAPWRDTLDVVRDVRAWQIGVVTLLFTLLDETFLAFTIAFVYRVHHTSLAVATGVGGALVVGALAGYAQAAARPRRAPARRALIAGALTLAGAGIAMAIAPNVPAVAAAALVSGAVSARFWNTLHATTLRLRPARAGTVKAVVSTIEFAGFPLPILIGGVADRAGLRAAMVLFAVIAAALAPLVALGPAWRDGEPFRPAGDGRCG